MNGNSKREKVQSFVEKIVKAAIAECAITSYGSAEWLCKNRGWIANEVSHQIDIYRMKELQDIMDWKKPTND